MTNINQLITTASKAGFNCYGCYFTDLWGANQHEVLTCTKGKYSGEVIDIYYCMLSGNVTKIEYSTQFKGQEPAFIFN